MTLLLWCKINKVLSVVSSSLAQVAELVDATDLKSVVLRDVPVQVRPWVPFKTSTDVGVFLFL